MMIRLKEEYKNKKITNSGIDYDFRLLTQEKLQRIYDNNKNLRHMFEEAVEITPEVSLNEKEFFETVKEVVKKPAPKKKK